MATLKKLPLSNLVDIKTNFPVELKTNATTLCFKTNPPKNINININININCLSQVDELHFTDSFKHQYTITWVRSWSALAILLSKLLIL